MIKFTIIFVIITAVIWAFAWLWGHTLSPEDKIRVHFNNLKLGEQILGVSMTISAILSVIFMAISGIILVVRYL